MLIPPIVPLLPTYSNFTRGELKIGRSLQRNCPSSLPCVSSAPVHSYRGSVRFSSKLRSRSKSQKNMKFSGSWANAWPISGIWKIGTCVASPAKQKKSGTNYTVKYCWSRDWSKSAPKNPFGWFSSLRSFIVAPRSPLKPSNDTPRPEELSQIMNIISFKIYLVLRVFVCI